uniref:Uncharacterized protein n=1 Tax=Oryza punctata TaxID=4537 RepID=A0A0E0MGW2_ORYPU
MVDGCECIQEQYLRSFDYHTKKRIDGELGAVLTHSMVIQAAVVGPPYSSNSGGSRGRRRRQRRGR